MSKNVLIVSVHPDDETLGCGGTIFRHQEMGDKVSCVFITSGNSHQNELINKLDEAYNFEKVYNLQLPEITLQDVSLSKIIPLISDVFKKVEANVIYLPNRFDPQSDHRRTFEACLACIKTFRYPFIKKVLMMEIISETDFAPALPENMFIPHVFVDISNHFDKKIEILKFFESELFDAPYTRSIDTMTAYNRYRGSQINAHYAECFMLIKEIL
jgi:LmbE family N-acetylglucosaminyl deacetylase